MAQQEVNGILEAFRNLLAYKTAQQQQALQQQQIDTQKQNVESEVEARKAAADLAIKAHEQEVKHQQAQIDLLKAGHKVVALQAAQKIGQAYQQEGAPLPTGSQVGPLSGGVQPVNLTGPLANIDQSQNTGGMPTQSVTLPIEGAEPLNFNVTPPDIYAKQTAERQRTLLAPQIEADIAKNAAIQKAETERQLKVAQLNQENENKRNAASNLAHIQSTNIMAAAHRYAAELQTGGGTLDPDNIQATLNNLAVGNLTQADINTMFPFKGQKNVITQAAVAAGIRPLNEKDKQYLKESAPAIQVLKWQDQFNSIMDSVSPVDLLNIRSPTYRTLTALQAQINEGLVSAMTQLKAAGRLNKEILTRGTGAYGVSMNPINLNTTRLENKQHQQEYETVLNEALNSHLAGYSPGQRAMILSNYGLQAHADPNQIFQVGQTVTDSTGKIWKKVKNGADNDKGNWESQ